MTQQGIHNLTDPLQEQVEALQERIAELTDRLSHAERLATMGTIAGLIAHEFNNILTPVMSYAQLALANGEDVDLVRKALQKAADGSEQASQIAAAILGFVKVERDRVDATLAKGMGGTGAAGAGAGGVGAAVMGGAGVRGPADVREAAETALACMGRDLEKDRIQVSIDVPRGTFAAIRPVALRHILLNLLLNARNAMLPRGGSLRVSVRRCERAPAAPAAAAVGGAGNGQWIMDNGESGAGNSGTGEGCTQNRGVLVVTVEDSGCGIQPPRLERIFEPFQPAEPRHPDLVGGSGLGLATCLRLVTEVGGTMWVQSEEGEGTTVSIVLPAAVGASAQTTTTDARGASGAGPTGEPQVTGSGENAAAGGSSGGWRRVA